MCMCVLNIYIYNHISACYLEHLPHTLSAQVDTHEPYKRDAILQKRPITLSMLLTAATPYMCSDIHRPVSMHINIRVFVVFV